MRLIQSQCYSYCNRYSDLTDAFHGVAGLVPAFGQRCVEFGVAACTLRDAGEIWQTALLQQASCMACWPSHQLADLGLVGMQGFFGKECENEALALEYNKPVIKDEASFEYDYYSLPELQGREVQGSVEVRVQASFSSSGASYWLAHPELLLLKVTSNSYTNILLLSHAHLTAHVACMHAADLCFPSMPSFSKSSLLLPSGASGFAKYNIRCGAWKPADECLPWQLT